MKHCMRLNPDPFRAIKSGQKIYELRLFDEKRRLIAPGDVIEFTNTDITYEITEGLAMSFGVEIAIDTNGTFTVTKKQS